MDKKSAEIFLKNFNDLCDSHSVSARSVLIKLGIAPSTIAKWRKGSMPSVATMNKIAHYFNVTITTLMGMTSEGEIKYHLSPISDDLEMIVRAYRKASEEDRQIVRLVLKKYETD